MLEIYALQINKSIVTGMIVPFMSSNAKAKLFGKDSAAVAHLKGV